MLLLALAGCDGTTTTATTPLPPSTPASPSGVPPASPSSSPAGASPAPSAPPTATTPTPTPTTPPKAEGLELTRSGGVAGITETITVMPDGTWAKVSSKPAVTARGKLTAAQLAALQRLLADPRLASEASGKNAGDNHCADAFTYLLVARHQLIRYTSCGQADKPEVTVAIIDLLQIATKGR